MKKLKIPFYLKLLKKLPRPWRCPRFSEMNVFVVTMYYHGNNEKHSYVLSVWSTMEKAINAGNLEKAYRNKKYDWDITVWEVDGNETVYNTRYKINL